MIIWKVTVKVNWNTAEFVFETAEEAESFAKTAMRGTCDDKPVEVRIYGVVETKEEEAADE